MENIEAMLCAYIEGDLDDAGRAEIEKHLRDNPQHRQLIAELIATRDLVRNLPRVKTSGDANESLRGQVARSILLDDPDNTSRPASGNRHRLPGVLVAAAIVLLCFTLGIIVYRMLGPTLKPTTFTPIAYTPSTAPDLLMTRTEPSTSPSDAESTGALRSIEKSAMNYGAPGGLPSASSDNAAAPEALAVSSAALTSDQLTDLKSRLRANGYLVAPAVSGKPGPILLVVHSATPQAAGDMIANFLAARTNSISWSEVPQTPGIAGTLHTAATTQPLSIVGQMSFTRQMSATTFSSTAPSIAAASSDQSQNFSRQEMQAMRSTLASTRPTTQSIEPGDAVLKDAAKALTDKASTMPAATQPSLAGAGNEVLNRDAAAARTQTFSHIYVAQNLTARDAAELQLSLAQPDLGQPAQVYESSAAPLAENLSLPTTLPAQMSGTATFTGQSMQITLATQPSAANSTQPAATNPTMTVNLPAPVDAVIVVQDTPAAAPITPAFGSDSYQAIEPPATNPSANPPATQPTTEPIAIPSTEPTSQPSP